MWAVVCKSGGVREVQPTVRAARSRANDAAFECSCRERGHRVVNVETGREYDPHKSDAKRSSGRYACSRCGARGHTRRRCVT